MNIALASGFALAYGLLCMKTGMGPLELAVFALQHARAAWRWTVREAWPAVYRVRSRYWEQLEEVRRG